MPHYAFGVTYNGERFHGWQRQNDVSTVQGDLERALSRIADSETHITVAGRTDAGVHATGQVAAFYSEAARTLHDWRRGLNALTSSDISVDWVIETSPEFHPRYSATARRYKYVFHDIGRAHPLLLNRVWGCTKLDADAMHRGAQNLLGEHDFSSFRGAGCQSLTPMRRVNRCEVLRHGDFIVMDIEANAFLLHMVRNIASALHALGSGECIDLSQLLALRDRTRLGATAPPAGLYLVGVTYPEFDLPVPATLSFLGL